MPQNGEGNYDFGDYHLVLPLRSTNTTRLISGGKLNEHVTVFMLNAFKSLQKDF